MIFFVSEHSEKLPYVIYLINGETYPLAFFYYYSLLLYMHMDMDRNK